MAASWSSAKIATVSMTSARSNCRRMSCRAIFTIQATICVVSLTSCGGQVDTPDTGLTFSQGGSTSASGGSTSEGGASIGALGGATSDTNLDVCSSDTDCTVCPFSTAPTNSNQCDSGWYCCYGVWLTVSRCTSNQAAWREYCPYDSFAPCPCPSMACATACVNGQCTGRCSGATR